MKEPDIIHATKRFEIEVFESPSPVHEKSYEDTPENIAYCMGCKHKDCIYDSVEECRAKSLQPLLISPKKDFASGVTGVSWSKANNKWVAQITIQYHNYYLGRYKKLEDAIAARKLAETWLVLFE